ncbi:hypothetical protein ACFLZ5_01930 [Thermodesulfobacteriota bacterium]
MQQEEKLPPLHTRFGLRLLQVLLIVLSMFLVKRCVDIYHENKITDQQIKIEYFEKGFASGKKKSMGISEDPEPQFKNYALKKAYRDGYRQGWDTGREEKKQP